MHDNIDCQIRIKSSNKACWYHEICFVRLSANCIFLTPGFKRIDLQCAKACRERRIMVFTPLAQSIWPLSWPTVWGSSLGCEFESLCAIEGSSRERTDKIAQQCCWTGILKNPTKCLCAVAIITEILLKVT